MKRKKKSDDAFGQQLLGWLSGEESPEVVERDDGYINASKGFGKRLYFSTFRNWPVHERRAITSVRGRVLDVGAGAGRHSLELQRRGHCVTAIDLSLGAIAVCRRRGIKDARLLSVDNIGKLPTKSFDTVIMMGNNFGLLQNFTKGRRILHALHRITTDSGRIIAATLDPYQTKNPDHRWYHRFNRSHGRMGGQIRIRVRYGKLTGTWHDYLFVSKPELRKMLAGTGWKLKHIINGRGADYIAIIEKDQERKRSFDLATPEATPRRASSG